VSEQASVTGPRILFMGTPRFAVPSLKALVERGFNVVWVVTQPSRPRGRGRRTSPTPVKEFALKHGLPVSEPAGVRDEGFVRWLRSLDLDLIVVVAYGKILPGEVLSVPRLGCVNLHASVLPRYRGAAPINWAIMNGDRKTGVTTMLMEEGMDTGPVLLTEEVTIGDDETAGELSERLSELGADLLVRTVRLFAEGRIEPRPQDDSIATYAPMLRKEDGRIDWKLGAIEIKNRVRGLEPWPGAYTYWKGRLLKIHSGDALETDAHGDVEPGTVVGVSKGGIMVKCGEGVFEIKELQIEGKRRMTADEFVRGYRLGKEEVFD